MGLEIVVSKWGYHCCYTRKMKQPWKFIHRSPKSPNLSDWSTISAGCNEAPIVLLSLIPSYQLDMPLIFSFTHPSWRPCWMLKLIELAASHPHWVSKVLFQVHLGFSEQNCEQYTSFHTLQLMHWSPNYNLHFLSVLRFKFLCWWLLNLFDWLNASTTLC